MFDWVLNTILKLLSDFAKKKKKNTYLIGPSIDILGLQLFGLFFFAKNILLPKEIGKII